MKRSLRYSVFFLAAAVLPVFAAAPEEKSSWQELFEIMDVNGDGVVCPREFSGSTIVFKRYDFDGDGVISREDMARYERGDRFFGDSVRLMADIPYKETPQRKLLLDVVVPLEATDRVPLVVWIHGGGWNAGDKRKGVHYLYPLIKAGFAVASIEYRLSDEDIFPAQIHDVKAAVRFLRAQAEVFNIDPERIGVWGLSAGGHLAALLGTSHGVESLEGDGPHLEQSSHVSAVCVWFGPSDFLSVSDRVEDNRHIQLLGGKPMDVRRLALLASPTTHADEGDPPFLIMHGTHDETVPLKQGRLLRAALKRQGVPVEFHKVQGGTHGGAAFSKPEVLDTVVRFFQHTLEFTTPVH